MRILWLLDKISNADHIFRQNSGEKLRRVFERLVEIFTSGGTTSASFPIKYQCLRTLYRYTKKINLKEIYSH